ncbi:MAG: right-handed parallel beta-helix repeat-containing protein [Planctomycetes bacterium]|nr:right-handed parallel beta-helix repeat-containing protein [Planctomycetota bacterium]
MSEFWIARAVAVAPLLALFLVTEVAAQPCPVPPTIYVNVRTGTDCNDGSCPIPGGSPTCPTPPAGCSPGPLQTITAALSLAQQGLLAGVFPLTIMIAGTLTGGTGTPMTYGIPGPGPALIECFPLPMLPAVSLVWDEANSDLLQVPPFPPVRPIIRYPAAATTTPPSAPSSLLRFSATPTTCFGTPMQGNSTCPLVPPATIGYTPVPGFPVTISGLVFSGGESAIEIQGNSAGPVEPILSNLILTDGFRRLLVTAGADTVNPTIDSCDINRGAQPWATGPTPLALADFSLTGSGSIGGSVQNCSFTAAGTSTINRSTAAGVSLSVPPGNASGSITTSISDSQFQGSNDAFGLQNGLLITENNSAGSNSGFFDVNSSGCAFTDLGTQAVRFFAPTTPGGTSTTTSTLTVTGARFTGGGTLPAPPQRGQLWVDLGAGHRATVNVSLSSFTGGPGSGIYFRPTTYANAGTPASILGLNLSQNSSQNCQAGGIVLRLAETDVQKPNSIARNKMNDNGGIGLDIYAGQVLATSSIPTTGIINVVNNVMGYNASHGMRTVAQSLTATYVASLTVRPTHNTIAGNGGYGLLRSVMVAPGNTTTTNAVQVHNSIFSGNALGDYSGLYQASDVYWTRITGIPVVGNFNVNYPPNFVNPALRNFQPDGYSLMRDRASGSPPAAPAVDLFGGPRRVDLAGVGYNGIGTAYADKGAIEVPQ